MSRGRYGMITLGSDSAGYTLTSCVGGSMRGVEGVVVTVTYMA